MISKKVILTGSFGVGKTSLFNQFIYNRFDDKYLTTIGVKVNKKKISINGKDLSMMLWDIAGEVSQDKVPTSYFLGASGIIYVIDLTRPSTYVKLENDIKFLQNILNGGVIQIIGNKKDLVTEQQIAEIKNNISIPWNIVTSAKTGENVDKMFLDLGAQLLV